MYTVDDLASGAEGKGGGEGQTRESRICKQVFYCVHKIYIIYYIIM